MIGFFIMLKCNIKLMLRNKASIFLIFLIPLFSTLILRIQISSMNTMDTLRMSVIVFDNSSSSESDELIKVLKNNSAYNIKVEEGMMNNLENAKEKSINLANKSINNGFIYIPSDFSKTIFNGIDDNTITIFTTGTDDRINILKSNIDMVLLRFNSYSKIANGDKEVFKELMERAELGKTVGESVSISEGEKILDNTGKNKIYDFGYFVAIMSIALIFSGNFISDILIEEKNNRVLKRITITKSSMLNYGVVKAIASLGILIIQTTMVVIGIKLFVSVDLGMDLGEIAILTFGLGLIFNTLRLALGTIFESVSTANYLAFFIVTISSLMSGLYFPIDTVPKWMQNISLLMPQTWIVKTAEQILLGTSGWIILFGVIVMAFVSIFMSIGYLGLKFNSK
ncbi:ABC transporter permease [Clostridium vincentii]|uniref:ABC-2 family transporter protein n=1 Tax=Clostridium vincentii TaxID=52704 RepID=A0A2T0BF78_9CLOT|nr:ABC transporter permease [Clostridium vincentii]PRR82534.1 ABC-2 family transporter protein [Clostridium vincentii]